MQRFESYIEQGLVDKSILNEEEITPFSALILEVKADLSIATIDNTETTG